MYRLGCGLFPGSSNVHPSTYIRIAQFQSHGLFPSLRHLEFYFTEGFGSHIFLFLSPLLDSLELYNISGFENTLVGPFLATLSSSPQMLRRFVLDSGRMVADILKDYFVHFRSVEISNPALMADFSIWEGNSLVLYRLWKTLLWRLTNLNLFPRMLPRIQIVRMVVSGILTLWKVYILGVPSSSSNISSVQTPQST